MTDAEWECLRNQPNTGTEVMVEAICRACAEELTAIRSLAVKLGRNATMKDFGHRDQGRAARALTSLARVGN